MVCFVSDPILTADPARRQSRALRTREQILSAATTVLVEHGYAGLTMQRVQSEAGVTRGALTHHFSSMRELAVAAIDYLAQTQLDEIRRVTGGANRKQLVDLLDDVIRRPTFLAGLELWAAARTDSALRDALRPGARALGKQLRSTLGPAIPDLESDQLDVFVDGLLALLRGLAMGGVLRSRRAPEKKVLAAWVAAFV